MSLWNKRPLQPTSHPSTIPPAACTAMTSWHVTTVGVLFSQRTYMLFK